MELTAESTRASSCSAAMCMACQEGSLKAVSAGLMRRWDMAPPLAAPDGVPSAVLTSPHVPAHCCHIHSAQEHKDAVVIMLVNTCFQHPHMQWTDEKYMRGACKVQARPQV